jgi:glycosyltransferase involved in cell wall biosynthesis
MKIGFDAKRLFHNNTGLGNYSRDLVRILAQYYPDNQYVLFNPKPKKINRVPIDEKVISEKLPLSQFLKKFSSLWRMKHIVSDLKKEQIVLYHGLSGELPIGIAQSGIKSIVTIHDLIFMRYPELYSYFDRKIHFKKFKYAAKNADLVIAISQQTKEDIVHYLNINPDKIKVIYQGCAGVFKDKCSDFVLNEVRKKYNLPEKYILNVGTIEKRKNVLTAIKAIKSLDIQLVIVGKKTKYFTEIEKYISENKMENKVIFLSNVELHELAALYQIAAIFVYPSIFEGFGIPIIEALYSKTPVISSKGSCFAEAGGPDSIYVEAENVHEIESAISLLLKNPMKCTEMTLKGYEFAQQFNDDSIAKNIMETYAEVLR